MRQTINITPNIAPYVWEGSPNSWLLLEDWRVWTPHLVPKHLRLPLDGQNPKTTSSECQQSLCLRSIKLANKEAILNAHQQSGYPLEAQSREGRWTHPSHFSLKELYLRILKLLPKGQASNLAGTRARMRCSYRQGKLEDAPPTFCFLLTARSLISSCKSSYTHICAPELLCLSPRRWSPDCLALIAHRGLHSQVPQKSSKQ